MYRQEAIVQNDRILLEMTKHQKEIGRIDTIIGAANRDRDDKYPKRYDIKLELQKLAKLKGKSQNNYENLKKRMHLIIRQITPEGGRI